MSALPGIVGLLVFIYVRPQELSPGLRGYDLLYVFLALCVLGIARDVLAGRVRLAGAPMTPYVVAFWAWCLFTLAVKKPNLVAERFVCISVCSVLYLIVSCSTQYLSTYFRITVVVFSLGLFVAAVGAEQGLSPFQCIVTPPDGSGTRAYGDGRECSNVDDVGWLVCVESGDPGVTYGCERVGLFDTTSVGGGRVRYLGVLEDPNDLALATAMALPFAFAFYQVRRSALRLALLCAAVSVVAVEIVFTQSRGGQLTFGAVIGTYFVQKYGWGRGVLVGCVMGVPMMLLGGRAGESADQSTLERLGCAAAGIKMLLYHPIVGVGYSEFIEYHNMTAHNSYVLAAGELGLLGMWLFGLILYLAIKVPYGVLRLPMHDDADSRLIKALALAVLASLIGGAVGLFFLSWLYHYILWIQLGVSGGLYAVVKRRHPELQCRVTLREAARVALGYVVVLAVWSQYIKHKGAWD